jgi:hypothetical protein
MFHVEFILWYLSFPLYQNSFFLLYSWHSRADKQYCNLKKNLYCSCLLLTFLISTYLTGSHVILWSSEHTAFPWLLWNICILRSDWRHGPSIILVGGKGGERNCLALKIMDATADITVFLRIFLQSEHFSFRIYHFFWDATFRRNEEQTDFWLLYRMSHEEMSIFWEVIV